MLYYSKYLASINSLSSCVRDLMRGWVDGHVSITSLSWTDEETRACWADVTVLKSYYEAVDSQNLGSLVLSPAFLDGTLFCFFNMAAKRRWVLWRATQNSTSKRSSKQGRTCLAFDDVASEVTECNFCFNLSVTAVTSLLTCGRGGKVSKNFSQALIPSQWTKYQHQYLQYMIHSRVGWFLFAEMTLWLPVFGLHLYIARNSLSQAALCSNWYFNTSLHSDSLLNDI